MLSLLCLCVFPREEKYIQCKYVDTRKIEASIQNQQVKKYHVGTVPEEAKHFVTNHENKITDRPNVLFCWLLPHLLN